MYKLVIVWVSTSFLVIVLTIRTVEAFDDKIIAN